MHKVTVLTAIVAALLAAPSGACAAPPNDSFENAAPLSQPPVTVTGTTVGATPQPGEGSGLPKVWYAFRPLIAQRVAIEAFDPGSEMNLVVYTGTAPADLQQIGEDDEVRNPRVEFDAAAGVTYWMSVGTYASQGSPFTLRTMVAGPPGNDFFSAAQRVKVGVEYSGSVADATPELGEPDGLGGNQSHSVWFRFRAARDARMTIDSGGSEEPHSLFAFTGDDLSDLHELVGGGDDSISPTGDGRVIRFMAKRGRTYHIALDAMGGVHSGEYKLWVSDGGVKGKGLTLEISPGQTVSSVRARGLRATVHSKRLVKVRLELVVSRRLAGRLKLRNVVLGSVKGSVDYGQDLATSIGLTSTARKALRHRTRLTGTLRLVILDRLAPDRLLTKRVVLSS